MSATPHQRVWLREYAPPDFVAEHIEMDVGLDPVRTVIRCTQHFRRRPGSDATRLRLQGRGFDLLGCWRDGRRLQAADMVPVPAGIEIEVLGDAFSLVVETAVKPASNQSALGLFQDGEALITHMEPDGMSMLTYCQDRPDSLSRYTVRLTADPLRYPILLSNGRLADKGELSDGRHYAVWQDDTPKPSYIFAIAAGRYARRSETFTRGDGVIVELAAYGSARSIDRAKFMLGALRRAMAFDEEMYGRLCDVGAFNVVILERHAISQENKGLMFLEAAFALADPDRSTDDDFDLVERITAHEYFHNWTGNRITCRDWFQLSLKEGLTRFRDQTFSAAMSAPDVKRITTVRNLRTNQFPEDAGGGAHAVRPLSYVSVSNLYTPTVYDKGAEIIRMARLLLGRDRFRAGMDVYFARHDLSAVTIEDLIAALAQGSGRDLSQFSAWYDHVGTPALGISQDYDPAARELRVRIRQTDASGALLPRPLEMPFSIGLMSHSGESLPVTCERLADGNMLELRAADETFVFRDVPVEPVVSCNRGFSAPVRVIMSRSSRELALLMASDPDGFARWDAGQELMIRATLERAGRLSPAAGEGAIGPLMDAMGQILSRRADDLSLVAELLSFPQVGLVANDLRDCDMDGLSSAWIATRRQFAERFSSRLREVYHALAPAGAFSHDPAAKGARRLRAVCLDYLMELGEGDVRALALGEVLESRNMTACSAALYALSNHDCPERMAALDGFRRRWGGEDDMMRLWFRAQALSRYPGAAGRVRALSRAHPFDISNVPFAMALFGGFFRQNRIGFHAGDGSGYRLLGDTLLELDRIRPSSTKWLMPQFMIWRQFDAPRQAMIREQLERIAASLGVSSMLFENVTRALQAPEHPKG